MFITPVIDYAYPMMAAEKSLKDAHLFALDKKHDDALYELTCAAAEIKMAINAINYMKEQEDALRKQTETV
jgi:hypothetical protein